MASGKECREAADSSRTDEGERSIFERGLRIKKAPQTAENVDLKLGIELYLSTIKEDIIHEQNRIYCSSS